MSRRLALADDAHPQVLHVPAGHGDRVRDQQGDVLQLHVFLRTRDDQWNYSTRSEAPVSPLRTSTPRRQPLGQLLDVGHHAHHAVAALQRVEGLHCDLERLGVERAEALVEEQALERLGGAARRAARRARLSASARARASDARKVSPPDSVRTERSLSPFQWSMTRKLLLVGRASA